MTFVGSDEKLNLSGAVELNLLLRTLTDAYRQAGKDPSQNINVVAHSQGTVVTTAALLLQAPRNTTVTKDIYLNQVIFIGSNLDWNALKTPGGGQVDRELARINWNSLGTGVLLTNFYSWNDKTVTQPFVPFADIPIGATIGAGRYGFNSPGLVSGTNYEGHIIEADAEQLVDKRTIVHTGEDSGAEIGWWAWLRQNSDYLYKGITRGFQNIISGRIVQGATTIARSSELVAYAGVSDSGYGEGILHYAAGAGPIGNTAAPNFSNVSLSSYSAIQGEWIIATAAGANSSVAGAHFYVTPSGITNPTDDRYVTSDYRSEGGWSSALSTKDLALGTWHVLILQRSETSESSGSSPVGA